MKTIAVSAWPPRKRRLHERVADEAAERLDLVLDHGRHFGGLDAAEALSGKRRMRSTSSKRRRRSMRSPSQPFKVLI